MVWKMDTNMYEEPVASILKLEETSTMKMKASGSFETMAFENYKALYPTEA